MRRGSQSAKMLKPRIKELSIIGVKLTGNTPKEGIEAPVIVVTSMLDLEAKANKVF